MKYIIVAVRDNAVQAYQAAVHLVRAEGEAIRNFQDAINDPQGRLNKHADDYDMYIVGYFNDETGTIEPCEPKQLARGKQMRVNEGISITR